MFPSNGSVTRRLASLPRVLPGGVSLVPRYYQGVTTPCRPSRRVSFPSRGRYQGRTRVSLPQGGVPPRGPGVVHPVPPAGVFLGDDRVSHVPGEPSCAYALLFDPGRSRHPTTRCIVTAPAKIHNEGPCNSTHFGAQSHGLSTHCLRFAGRVAPPPRKTRFRLLVRLYRAGLATHRVPAKGFERILHPILLSQAFVAHGRVALGGCPPRAPTDPSLKEPPLSRAPWRFSARTLHAQVRKDMFLRLFT